MEAGFTRTSSLCLHHLDLADLFLVPTTCEKAYCAFRRPRSFSRLDDSFEPSTLYPFCLAWNSLTSTTNLVFPSSDDCLHSLLQPIDESASLFPSEPLVETRYSTQKNQEQGTAALEIAYSGMHSADALGLVPAHRRCLLQVHRPSTVVVYSPNKQHLSRDLPHIHHRHTIGPWYILPSYHCSSHLSQLQSHCYYTNRSSHSPSYNRSTSPHHYPCQSSSPLAWNRTRSPTGLLSVSQEAAGQRPRNRHPATVLSFSSRRRSRILRPSRHKSPRCHSSHRTAGAGADSWQFCWT